MHKGIRSAGILCSMATSWALGNGVNETALASFIGEGMAEKVLGHPKYGPECQRTMERVQANLRAALTVRTETAMPAAWAMTQNNLGNVIGFLGERAGGESGLSSLRDAVTAYRAALTVYTESEMPADWAMTQQNLGVTHLSISELVGVDEATIALRAALSAFDGALPVYTPEYMPFDWGTAAAARDKAERRLAALEEDGEKG